MLYTSRVLPNTSKCRGENIAGSTPISSFSVAMHRPVAQQAAKTLVYNIQLTNVLSSRTIPYKKNKSTAMCDNRTFITIGYYLLQRNVAVFALRHVHYFMFQHFE